ncbi:transcriptional regulator domain-containing protein [Ochrobactrum teleogrylli]|uniref:transcriptional regulator domain-containing protein n=1 Tax=Ochrobactrum teleogrylli TaxID=2479765 RepID=UPI00384DB0F2
MTPDASIWRSSEYDHLDGLTASDLAWEWLRRNDAYDADFEASASARGMHEPLTVRIRQQWGLRFPGRSPDTSAGSASLLASAGGHKRCHARRGAR